MFSIISSNKWLLAALVLLAGFVYYPQPQAEFVLDDHYSIVRNPYIKAPQSFGQIWTHRLFDAHPSSGYIKLPYYRPILQSSYILDYALFKLDPRGYQWINLLIHVINALLVICLVHLLFANPQLALGAGALFLFFPANEWVVRYITGRGDSLYTLFGLVFLLSFVLKRYWLAGIFLILSLLTREVACLLPFFAFIILYVNDRHRFSFWWVLAGLSVLLVTWPMIPKQGNVLVWHFFYFASIGVCVWLAGLKRRLVMVLVLAFALFNAWQGKYWTSEEVLLRHTRELEWWDWTVSHQQLVMRYDDDLPAVNHLISSSRDDIVKSMWVRRRGVIYFNRGDLRGAKSDFEYALKLHPKNTDAQSALEVVNHAMQ